LVEHPSEKRFLSRMAKRDNHYEHAFEAYLRSWQLPYVSVNEQRRAVYRESCEREAGALPSIHLRDKTLKSLDFIVSPGGGRSWLVDVKGRRFPSGDQYFKNWSTRDDLESLARWQTVFGPQFHSLLMFAYEIVGERSPLPSDQLFEHRSRLYAFIGVHLHHYSSWCRTISPKWQTVAVSPKLFRQLARPAEEIFLRCGGTGGILEDLQHPQVESELIAG